MKNLTRSAIALLQWMFCWMFTHEIELKAGFHGQKMQLFSQFYLPLNSYLILIFFWFALNFWELHTQKIQHDYLCYLSLDKIFFYSQRTSFNVFAKKLSYDKANIVVVIFWRHFENMYTKQNAKRQFFSLAINSFL